MKNTSIDFVYKVWGEGGPRLELG